MTLLALVLKRRYFDQGISLRLAYVTLGLLFVNISIGGTLTNFAAPPVLMVAAKWEWSTPFMLQHFGWRAALSCLVSTAVIAFAFRRELLQVPVVHVQVRPGPGAPDRDSSVLSRPRGGIRPLSRCHSRHPHDFPRFGFGHPPVSG